MKKFSFKVAMVAVVATVAGMGIYSSQKADVTSDIALANGKHWHKAVKLQMAGNCMSIIAGVIPVLNVSRGV